MEPPPLPAGHGRGPQEPAPEGVQVTTPDAQNLRAGLVAAALAAGAVGLLGVGGGVVWLVAAVFTVRAVWGRPVGLAWGIACLGAAFRFGSATLGDVAAATRLVGPGVAAGTTTVRVAMALMLAAAVVSEAREGALRRRAWPERAAGLMALVALVVLFCAPGPGEPSLWVSLTWWSAVGAGLVALVVVLGSLAARVPAWVPVVVAAAGVVAVGVAS